MNPPEQREWHRLFNAALNDELSAADQLKLAAVLKSSAEARQLWFLYQDNECSLAELRPRPKVESFRVSTSRFQWRPLTAAAAGIAFGMFCTSLVFAFVVQRAEPVKVDVVKRTPLAVFDPGLENTAPITARNIPNRVGAWGAGAGRVVMAENGVEPREGQRMLRLEPIPRNKQGKTGLSRAFQMLNLRSLPKDSRRGDTDVEVTASFCAANNEVNSLYSIQIFAVDQPPEKARNGFWQKTEDAGVVSAQQTFGTEPGEGGWQTFSLKMPLPRGARTLVIVLAAGVPKDSTENAAMYYLDDVQVSVLTTEPSPDSSGIAAGEPLPALD